MAVCRSLPGMEKDKEVGGYELAEEVTGIRRATLYSMVSLHQIPHYRITRRMVRFSRTELSAWMIMRAVHEE